MTTISLTSCDAKADSNLNSSPCGENIQLPSAGSPCQTGSSPAPNICSVPKSIENKTEKIETEKNTYEAYVERKQKCMHDIETTTGKALSMCYSKEYKTWSNCKHRSKNLKGITGQKWGTELDTFPGFLKNTGPIRNEGDSLDRIDPLFGYVVGNLRWASKQLQSENRRNVELIRVRGVPMTKHQLADLLGITYDAFRMKVHRGQSPEDILAEHFKAGKPATHSLSARIEACPWPKGKEQPWEAAFQAERKGLFNPGDQQSRTEFFVAKCNQELSKLNQQARKTAENLDPNEDVPVDVAFAKQHEYWMGLRKFAWAQQELVRQEKAPLPYCLDPSEDELVMLEGYKGAPPAITAEDLNEN